jgi:hypothetical protein
MLREKASYFHYFHNTLLSDATISSEKLSYPIESPEETYLSRTRNSELRAFV